MFVRLLIRVATLAVIGLVIWSVAAGPSGAGGKRTVYEVHAGDTLWTIAAGRYGGDIRSAVWKIQTANHLADASIEAGQHLLLP